MLIAVAVGLLSLFGGPDGALFGELMSKYGEDAITITITDEERRELALEGLTLLKGDYDDFNSHITEEISVLRGLLIDYQSRPEDFENNYKTMLSSRQKIIDDLWENRSRMLDNITSEEWEKIFVVAKKAAQE